AGILLGEEQIMTATHKSTKPEKATETFLAFFLPLYKKNVKRVAELHQKRSRLPLTRLRKSVAMLRHTAFLNSWQNLVVAWSSEKLCSHLQIKFLGIRVDSVLEKID